MRCKINILEKISKGLFEKRGPEIEFTKEYEFTKLLANSMR